MCEQRGQQEQNYCSCQNTAAQIIPRCEPADLEADLKRIAQVLASAALIVIGLTIYAPAAKADSVAYTFTGTKELNGTSFSYLSTTGFLAFPTGPLTPTSATDLLDKYYGNEGQITSFEFDSNNLAFTTVSHNVAYGLSTTLTYNLTTLGNQSIYDDGNYLIGTLNIAQTSVPEPSSLTLLGVGLFGLALAASLKRKAVGSSRASA